MSSKQSSQNQPRSQQGTQNEVRKSSLSSVITSGTLPHTFQSKIEIDSNLDAFHEQKNKTQHYHFDSKEELRLHLHILLQFYIQEQILKYYCDRNGWKFQKSDIQKYFMPVFDLLGIQKQNVYEYLSPFLVELTHKQLIGSSFDLYSHFSKKMLLLQVTEIWLKIRKSEIQVKRELKQHFEWIKEHFFQNNEERKCKKFNKQKLYTFISRGQDKAMITWIKVYIFCYKSMGELDQKDWTELESWINS